MLLASMGRRASVCVCSHGCACARARARAGVGVGVRVGVQVFRILAVGLGVDGRPFGIPEVPESNDGC